MLLRELFAGAVVLAVGAPVLAVGLWQNRSQGRRTAATVVAVAALIVLEEIVLQVPDIGPFNRLDWNWQGKILEVCLSISAIVMLRLAPEEAAVHRPRQHWLLATARATTVVIVLPVAFFLARHARQTLTSEDWAFLLTMPGLAEELLFRGVIQGLLNRCLGKPWRLFGARIGWGWLITSTLFVAAHIVQVNQHLQVEFNLIAGTGPLVLSLIGGWLREKVASVWPVVALHNLGNLFIPALTLLTQY